MVEKLKKITIICRHCHKLITKMAVRFYYDASLHDNFNHSLRMTCPFCRLVENHVNIFKEEK